MSRERSREKWLGIARRTAERSMTDRCRIERRGAQHWNGSEYVAEAPTQVYEGRCLIKAEGPGVEYGPTTTAIRESSRTRYDLSLPVWVEDVEYGDVVTMDQGQRYYVDSVEDTHNRTVRHVYVTDIDYSTHG